MKLLEWLLGPKGCLTMVVLGIISFPLMLYLPRIPETQVQSKVKNIEREMQRMSETLPQQLSLKTIDPQLMPSGKVSGYVFPTFHTGFKDPFSPEGDMPFAVYERDDFWLLISPGPDEKYGDPPANWMPDDDDTIRYELTIRSYDISNGAFSPGDIFRSSVDKRDGDK